MLPRERDQAAADVVAFFQAEVQRRVEIAIGRGAYRARLPRRELAEVDLPFDEVGGEQGAAGRGPAESG